MVRLTLITDSFDEMHKEMRRSVGDQLDLRSLVCFFNELAAGRHPFNTRDTQWSFLLVELCSNVFTSGFLFCLFHTRAGGQQYTQQ